MSVTPANATLVLSVDLDAVVDNWRTIRDMTGPAECAAVVKADSYGLGGAKVARALVRAGCRTFFVATVAEGIEIRRVVGNGPVIFVLNGPLPGTETDFAGHSLVPILNSLGQIALWRDFASKVGRALDAGLHLDTGMSRLGLEAAETRVLVAEPALLSGLRIRLVMSHMACADEATHAMNWTQAETFTQAAPVLAPGAALSLAASSATFLGRHTHFDLVRPGAALYGLNPTPGKPNPMANVVRLEAKILQVRDVDTPMTVGYGATHRISGKGRLATVGAGYADGYFRSLGSRGHGIIKGEKVPVVGRVSMDLTTFDISHLPPSAVMPGDMIELIGPKHDVDALALEAGTIGYEILTALGDRCLRSYLGDVA